MNITFLCVWDPSKMMSGISRGFTRFFLCVAFAPLFFSLAFESRAAAQEPADKSVPAAPRFRPCPVDSKSAAKNKKKVKAGQTLGGETTRACREVQGSPLEIQEFLEALARDQKWHLGQAQASEDGWSFVRYLEPEELARFAHTEILGGRITWTEGKAAVQVMTTDAGDGFTRVQISAKFLGQGNTRERFARPTNMWPLASKGVLEGDMLAALEARLPPKD